MAQRIQRQWTRGWRMPPGTVWVGGGTFRNPFKVGDWYVGSVLLAFPVPTASRTEGPMAGGLQVRRCTRALAVDWYRQWAAHAFTGADLEPLRGRDLCCWCPLVDVDGNPVPCHADVLLERLASLAVP